MKMIDLRSDTVTTPTPEMRRAMAEAEVGDDVYGEDPTVNRLEALAAARLGKEAAVFVPTGTMGNQASALAHTRRGDEVIVEAQAHIYYYEVGGLAALSSVQVRTVPGRRGAMDPDQVAAAIRDDNIHNPRTALVCLENTHNRAGGAIVPQATVQAIADLAHRRGIAVHMDGARIFNAAVATGRSAAELAAPADTVMFCLSKGLSAPVGSMVCGSAELIGRVRKARKILGGGMRQAGVLAAAGIVALEQMVERLAEDHANARLLADGLARVPGLAATTAEVETNMVMVDVTDGRWATAAQVTGALRQAGVLANAMGPRRIRLVTHKDVTRADMGEALDRMAAVVKAGPRDAASGPVYG